MSHTPAPNICPSCPWRTTTTPTVVQVQALRHAQQDRTIVRCSSRQPTYTGTLCAAWLATCGADTPTVVAAVAVGRIPVEALQRRLRWPALRDSVDAVLAAVYESPDGRVDPLMVALREAREATGLSQATVARRLRVTVETVRSDETGRRQPNLARLRGYADVYGVDLAVVARSQP